jgi:mannose-1-phosphate guanylyltransferase
MATDGSVGAAMILSAGLGTRLRPLTDVCAKPMVPVGDRPAVAHVLRQVRLAGASRVVVNVHHRPDELRAWAEPEGVLVSHEEVLLGTAGGVARAGALLGDGDVLVWNGDILSSLDPRLLVAAHARGAAAAPAPGGKRHDGGEPGHGATLAVLARPAGEGNVGLDPDGRVVRLRGERFGQESSGGEFLGIHVLGAQLRAALPARGCLVGDVYLPSLRRGGRLRGYVTSASFVDVGTIERYLAANAAWLAAEGLRSWAHPSASVRAPIDGSVVGAGAIVDAPALASVVWPGMRVQSACNGCVVSPAGVTRAGPE